MSVICPHCQTRCGDDDTYCSTCGTSLSGVTRTPDDGADHGGASPMEATAASTWPDASDADTVAQAERPRPRVEPETDEHDFVPLQFDSPAVGLGAGGRRWLLLLAALIALLALGTAAAMLWDRGGDGRDPATDAPLAAIGASPTATESATRDLVVVASPASTSEPVAATEIEPTSAAVGTRATATVMVQPAATAEATIAPTATVAPTSTTVPALGARPTATSRAPLLSDAGLLPSNLLRGLEDVRAATPRAGATPAGTPTGSGTPATPPTTGDGTGGVILLPAESTAIPEIGPAQPTPTLGAD